MSLIAWFWLYVGLVFLIFGIWDRRDRRRQQ